MNDLEINLFDPDMAPLKSMNTLESEWRVKLILIKNNFITFDELMI